MAKIKLELDRPIQGATKFAKGKFFGSQYPDGDSTMYGLASGDVIFVEHKHCQEPDELFASKQIGANEPFEICLRKSRSGAKYYEVKRLSEAAEPALDPARYPDAAGGFASKLERDLAASVAHVQQQRKAAVTPSKIAPSSVAATTAGVGVVPNASQHVNPIALVPERPRAGSLMSSAMVAAVDAVIIAQAYAASKGLAIAFGPEDIRAIAATLYIQHGKDNPGFAQRQGGR
jgi:hypothetical protein